MFVHITDPSTMQKKFSMKVDHTTRSVDFHKFLLIGQRNGVIIECDVVKQAHQTIMEAHFDGETWGLTLMNEMGCFITSGDDGKILMFDMKEKKCIAEGLV